MTARDFRVTDMIGGQLRRFHPVRANSIEEAVRILDAGMKGIFGLEMGQVVSYVSSAPVSIEHVVKLFRECPDSDAGRLKAQFMALWIESIRRHQSDQEMTVH